jgi:hypothetical protein
MGAKATEVPWRAKLRKPTTERGTSEAEATRQLRKPTTERGTSEAEATR